MAEWLDELNHKEKICEQTKNCKDCKLGYCIKNDSKLNNKNV